MCGTRNLQLDFEYSITAPEAHHAGVQRGERALVDAGRTLADQVPRCSCDRDAVDSRGRTSFSIVIVAPAALLSQPWQCHVHEYAHGRCARVRQLRTDGLRGRFEAPDVRQMTLSSRTPMAL